MDIVLRLTRLTFGGDAFPHLSAMDGNFGAGVEAQPNAATSNVEHRNFEQLLAATGPGDYH
jgi:hypothetical protein